MPATRSLLETAKEIVAAQQAAWDKRYREGGVCLSGIDRPYPKLEKVEAVVARLEAQEAERDAFRRTACGRFLTCIEELEETGFDEEAYRLRGFYSRSISDADPDQAAIGECIVILNGVGTRTAREGIDALAELLTVQVRKAA